MPLRSQFKSQFLQRQIVVFPPYPQDVKSTRPHDHELRMFQISITFTAVLGNMIESAMQELSELVLPLPLEFG